MDPQLIAFLEERFRESRQHVDNRFDQLETRFGQLEARFDKLEIRFGHLEIRVGQLEHRVGQLEHRMGQLEHRVGQLDDRVGQQGLRLDRLEETGRQTLVMVEGLRDEVHLVAEAFVGLDERLQRLHNENTAVYDQVRGWIEPAFRGIDGRVQALEGRSDTRHLDVLDAVRQMLARPPAPMPVISE